MNAMNVAKTAATVIIIAFLAAIVSAYLTGCSSFEAEATVNPITGHARLSVKSEK